MCIKREQLCQMQPHLVNTCVDTMMSLVSGHYATASETEGTEADENASHTHARTHVRTRARTHTHTHTHVRLTALCPGLPGWAGTRKVKPIWILLKQETVSGSGISWARCKSASRCRWRTTPTPHCSVFYRPDALPAAQPTASKHCFTPEGTKKQVSVTEVSIGVTYSGTAAAAMCWIISVYIFMAACVVRRTLHGGAFTPPVNHYQLLSQEMIWLTAGENMLRYRQLLAQLHSFCPFQHGWWGM